MSDLVICKHRRDRHTWHWMLLLRPGVIKPQTRTALMHWYFCSFYLPTIACISLQWNQIPYSLQAFMIKSAQENNKQLHYSFISDNSTFSSCRRIRHLSSMYTQRIFFRWCLHNTVILGNTFFNTCKHHSTFRDNPSNIGDPLNIENLKIYWGDTKNCCTPFWALNLQGSYWSILKICVMPSRKTEL